MIRSVANAAFNCLIARARRTPYFHLPGYMERWWLVPYKTDIGDGTGPVSFRQRPLAWLLQQLGVAVRVHHILRGDVGPDPHDHPWPYITVILRGGYIEERYQMVSDSLYGAERAVSRELVSSRWHGAGSVLFRRAGDWHKLYLSPAGQTTWTLFITFPKAKSWGFLLRDGSVVPYQEYKERR